VAKYDLKVTRGLVFLKAFFRIRKVRGWLRLSSPQACRSLLLRSLSELPALALVFCPLMCPGSSMILHDQRGRLRPMGGRGVDPPWCLQMFSIYVAGIPIPFSGTNPESPCSQRRCVGFEVPESRLFWKFRMDGLFLD
jgi:hypothetical protein